DRPRGILISRTYLKRSLSQFPSSKQPTAGSEYILVGFAGSNPVALPSTESVERWQAHDSGQAFVGLIEKAPNCRAGVHDSPKVAMPGDRLVKLPKSLADDGRGSTALAQNAGVRTADGWQHPALGQPSLGVCLPGSERSVANRQARP